MENREKDDIKVKWALTLRKLIDANKAINLEKKASTGKKDKNIIDSLGKLETETSIDKAALIKVINARKNATIATWMVILDALKISLTNFATIHDQLTEKEISDYKASLNKPLNATSGTSNN